MSVWSHLRSRSDDSYFTMRARRKAENMKRQKSENNKCFAVVVVVHSIFYAYIIHIAFAIK